jgi:hypothetical protein
MRNSLILVLMVVIAICSCATLGTDPDISNATKYEDVVEAPGMSAADLYNKVNMWFVDVFKSADSVIQYSDKDAGVIKGKYSFSTTYMMFPADIVSTITVEVKDGKYRVLFNDPHFISYNAYRVKVAEGPLRTQEMADKTKEEWGKLAEKLKDAIKANSSSW